MVKRPSTSRKDGNKRIKAKKAPVDRNSESVLNAENDVLSPSPFPIPLSTMPENIMQVKQLLTVLHTNPDSRYSELKMKRVSNAIGYLPPFSCLNPATPDDDRSDGKDSNRMLLLLLLRYGA